MIDKATIQRIKDAADIVEVVSDYVHLTRRGANYMGLCPFHNERTPSFSVNKRRNFCYCFSCHKGGSPVNFIMEKEGVSYHDALKHLAKKYGIKVEERELTDEERRKATEREGMLVAAEWAMKQMERDLVDTPEGRDVGLSYFYSRGVTEEAIRAFHLGYSIDRGNHLTPLMQKAGFELDVMRALGLTGQSQAGNLYDKYRGRVIFPIMNSSGKVVGFGGRDLKGGPAKYINSPESVLYRKNNELYGIYQAKSEIVRQNRCFLVEGYLDVISMWQSGMQNVVASSGTALTDGQIAIIHRFTDNITLLYDGDAAGIKAALRGIDMLLSHKMNVNVLLLPDGDDPDSFARKHTPEEFREYVAAHETDIIRFKMKVLMEGMGDSPQQKAAVINSVVESIACIHNDVERTVYVGECSRMMKVDEEKVAAAVERARFRIIEQQRLERARRKAEEDYPLNIGPSQANSAASAITAPSAADSQQPADSQQSADSQQPADSSQAVAGSSSQPDNQSIPYSAQSEEQRWMNTFSGETAKNQYPLRPLERNMIEKVVKYGYMPFRFNDNTDGGEAEQDAADNDMQSQQEVEELYTVVDFVKEELEADSVDFSVPEYKKVFDALMAHIDEYIANLDAFKVELEQKLAAAKQEGEQKIASSCQSVDDIEREEMKLQESIAKMRTQDLDDFARLYPGDWLASHEDNDIRRIANEMINDKYVLSNLFAKNQPRMNDEDLVHSVVRTMTEWKSEILNQHLKAVMEKFRRESGVDEENDRQMMQQINSLMRMRSQVAKDIGERIISPRKI